jgi:hypothetical protein
VLTTTRWQRATCHVSVPAARSCSSMSLPVAACSCSVAGPLVGWDILLAPACSGSLAHVKADVTAVEFPPRPFVIPSSSSCTLQQGVQQFASSGFDALCAADCVHPAPPALLFHRALQLATIELKSWDCEPGQHLPRSTGCASSSSSSSSSEPACWNLSSSSTGWCLQQPAPCRQHASIGRESGLVARNQAAGARCRAWRLQGLRLCFRSCGKAAALPEGA